MSQQITFSRRSFLQTSGAATGGLVLGFYLPGRWAKRGLEGALDGSANGSAQAAPFAPNAFIRIASDETITVLVNHSEMGQGVYTSLPMLIAEELDADWSRVRAEMAPAEPAYVHAAWGMMVTGGSSSVTSSWQQFRNAGAAARALLAEAAAQEWGVPASGLRTENGFVIDDAGDRKASYGSLAEAAATVTPPTEIALKDPKDFKLIGTDVKRIEGPDKVTGRAEFALDVKLPDMLTASVAHPPACGGTVVSFDEAAARGVPGVVGVKQISTGVAVIARDFWTARRGRSALNVEWDLGEGAQLSTPAVLEQYRALTDEPGAVAGQEGDAAAALASSSKTLEATYEVPYLAHAPMEPLSATAHVSADGCDIWAGTQFQTNDQLRAAQILGLQPQDIRVHTTLLGGGFGRRANATSDFVSEAVEVAKGESVPVKTVWTREDDIQCGYYRPLFVHRLWAGVDESGMPAGWHQRIVGQSIMTGTLFEAGMQGGIDPTSVEGAADMPYAIPNQLIELHSPTQPVSVLWWRSVGHTHTGFVNESFLDEVAHAGGQDPYELRRTLLADEPRHRGVLELAAEKAGWGTPLPEGRARGIAMRKSFDTFVAQVAEVSLTDDGRPRVHRVVCAVDCGIVVNPWTVKAQMEGGIVFGLTAALYGELTIDGGRVQQSNFHDYPVLRMNEMPEVEVHIVESAEHPTGVGEPGVPPIAPAVTNALFALTGKRVRKLPIRLDEAE
jgi:isoquinoline 1-oxidoreductase beta subunit